MAFGFQRLPGIARRYVNQSNPDFAPGAVISRRQYSAYTDRIIQEYAAEEQKEGAEAIAAAQRHLDDIADSLRRRQEAEAGTIRSIRHGAGQRRYNALLDAYRLHQRERGHPVGKREAMQSAEFKALVADVKGKPNKRRSPIVMEENRQRRRAALARVGGADFFRQQYESLYGGRTGGHGLRVNATGRSITTRRRIV
jgi:hypothetical protein